MTTRRFGSSGFGAMSWLRQIRARKAPPLCWNKTGLPQCRNKQVPLSWKPSGKRPHRGRPSDVRVPTIITLTSRGTRIPERGRFRDSLGTAGPSNPLRKHRLVLCRGGVCREDIAAGT